MITSEFKISSFISIMAEFLLNHNYFNYSFNCYKINIINNIDLINNIFPKNILNLYLFEKYNILNKL
jgi:hypothetical protein